MRQVHDRGGWSGARRIERAEHELLDWERRTDAMMQLLSGPEKRIIRVDELRRAIESLPLERYESLSYYERWVSALEILMIEKNVLTREEVEGKLAELERGERGGA
ncbi:MAG: nitrile hydratase subunit beta [Candidatus Rokubacteria bacterium]|nr:nitrile hydratase subunit beta [Candidatus Rokubacteria bacterium]